MIPQPYITEWSAQAPWPSESQIEQDLILSSRLPKNSRFEFDRKPDVGDVRESPALKILTLLRGLGAELRYRDPHVPVLHDYGLNSVSLKDALEDADLALIVTAHPQVDHELLAQRARLLVDLRGITRGSRVENVVRL